MALNDVNAQVSMAVSFTDVPVIYLHVQGCLHPVLLNWAVC